MDPPHRRESYRSLFPPKDCQQALLAANRAVRIFGRCCSPEGTRMSPIASGDRGDIEQDKKPSQQQIAPAEVPETGTTRMRETVLTRSCTKESHVAGDQLRKSCNAGFQRGQQSIPWQKVKREMQRNSDELLHSLSEEFPKAETLNSQKRAFGYLGERIG
ncbi:hypothetical protein NDU88_005326 [Pleurodeles waltl]|uniref:Uncharacterized protein n=1 Tax=Pleurodeles waltl TaxID=8319 RepID=A0AAV7NM69_PLEWA|nr:hypothetical protein NDU88_005326 [Pleurodeles waltl]